MSNSEERDLRIAAFAERWIRNGELIYEIAEKEHINQRDMEALLFYFILKYHNGPYTRTGNEDLGTCKNTMKNALDFFHETLVRAA